MIRLLMIPVGGTIAALVAIVLAHEPRGDVPPRPPPFEFPTQPLEPPEPHEPPAEAPTPEPREYQVELAADGTFLVLTGEEAAFASIEELQEQLGTARHTLVLSNGEGVTEAALDAVLAQLRDRYQVRKVYRAPEAPPAEGR